MKSHAKWMAALTLLGVTLGFGSPLNQESVWKVPSRQARKKNPLPESSEVLAAGKIVFEKQCVSCHGTSGVGDGVAAKDLEKHPGDLTSAAVQAQSDGALFWKISTGRAPMTAFGDTLSVEERWQVVRHIRTFAAGTEMIAPEFKAPEALRGSLSGLVRPYEKLQMSLAKADESGAKSAVASVASAIDKLSKIDTTKLESKINEAWKQSVKALSVAASKLKEASNLAELRASFGGLSPEMEKAWARFGHTQSSPLFVFECPMASKTGSLRWIQETREPQNPYLGSKMASCVTLLHGIKATRP